MAIKPTPEECELVERIAALCAEAHKMEKQGEDAHVVITELTEALEKYEELRLKSRNSQMGLSFPLYRRSVSDK